MDVAYDDGDADKGLAIEHVAVVAGEEPALAVEEPAEEPAKAVPDGFVVGARVLAK